MLTRSVRIKQQTEYQARHGSTQQER